MGISLEALGFVRKDIRIISDPAFVTDGRPQNSGTAIEKKTPPCGRARPRKGRARHKEDGRSDLQGLPDLPQLRPQA